ncbi:class I SAM-dependent methyltransferase [Nannocystis bainbridge]|uniref:Class I SAM-dependent methyltransferase n=1 Tax=Nannocystis bainbridge TaxID=2995303 RepID=A0ABT5E8S5_9BACT|nr:class I SAM-dependent methyltransferase [Nannocystis bainbridge]MDC0721156.1 class I SAM-dependent methyltransferase [Nannocystis bainbridge]
MEHAIDSDVAETIDMATEAGQAAYTRSFLPRYDFLVLNLNNNLLWRCPTARMVEHYDAHVTDRHMDAGVGSGYFLDHCRFPGASPHIALVDLNPNTLMFVRERIRRYADVTLYRRNILRPLRIAEKFDSIGISYLLHCLPGLIEDKAVTVFEHLKPCLNPGGVVFGSTLLYDLSMKHFFARLALDVYQRSGAMSNRWDTLPGLEAALKRSFSRYELFTVGCTAFFSGRV